MISPTDMISPHWGMREAGWVQLRLQDGRVLQDLHVADREVSRLQNCPMTDP